jgi:hypothetical protein
MEPVQDEGVLRRERQLHAPEKTKRLRSVSEPKLTPTLVFLLPLLFEVDERSFPSQAFPRLSSVSQPGPHGGFARASLRSRASGMTASISTAAKADSEEEIPAARGKGLPCRRNPTTRRAGGGQSSAQHASYRRGTHKSFWLSSVVRRYRPPLTPTRPRNGVPAPRGGLVKGVPPGPSSPLRSVTDLVTYVAVLRLGRR